MTIYAYLRVSTDMQDCNNQKQGVINWLKYKGWTCDEWVIEQGVSGKVDYRKRLLGRLLSKTQPGDWVIVSELSRLSRSMVDTFELVKELSRKGVNVFCVKENIQIADDALGLMILASFAFAAQIERERISQRTKEALERVKARGVRLGRPLGRAYKLLSLDNNKKYVLESIDDGESLVSIARKMSVSPTTLRHWLNKNGLMTHYQDKFRKQFPNGNGGGGATARNKNRKVLYLPGYSVN